MVRWPIAVPRGPRGGPDEADRAEDDEACAPSDAADEEQRQRNRDHPAEPRPEEHQAARAPALDARKPPCEGAHDVWKRAGLSRAEHEPHGDERAKALHRAGEHREHRPPEHDTRQYAARSAYVPEPAGRNLE